MTDTAILFIALKAALTMVVAAIAAWLSTRGRAGERLALGWKAVGLFALANIVIRSALTSPGTLNLRHTEGVNRAIGTLPHTFIAGLFAPLAVILQVLARRCNGTRHSTSTAHQGLPA